MFSKKKIFGGILIFILISSSSGAVEKELALDINNLNNEYKLLEQKERVKFDDEMKLAQIAEKKLELLINIKEKLIKKLENTNKIREKRFFKKDYDKLVKKYKKYLEEVNKEIKIQEKNIAEFLMLKELRGE